MLDVPLNAKVECADGACGETVTVILDPVARKLTHFVVEDQNLVQRIVPIDQVVETAADSIYLHCSKDELEQMEPFVEMHFVKNEAPDPPYYPGGPMYMLPYATPMHMIGIPVEVEHVPLGEIAVRRGTLVEATDGYVGDVAELLVDPGKGEITHFVLQEGHLWGKKEITLPLSAIDRVVEETVYLKLDKDAIEALPSVPVKRHYGFWWPWKEVELVATIYDHPDGASEELDFVTKLHRARTINILDSALLVRDEDGATTLKETGDLDARQGRLFGAITGGLIGLAGGPVGAVVGALAGAGTGGLAAKRIDMGFSEEFLTGLQERLQPGTSALILLVEHGSTVKLSEALAKDEGVMFQQTLTDELIEELLQTSEEEEGPA
jgi:uncharacterized membrane protein